MSRPSRFTAARPLAAVAIVLLAGCGGESKPASTLTQDQRDTVLSKSEIPGGSAVGHAFDAAGKEASHAAELDSLVH
ncbi:MAG: hypothetical protein ABL977_11345 [Candidatus Eisenbacteria bacterium]